MAGVGASSLFAVAIDSILSAEGVNEQELASTLHVVRWVAFALLFMVNVVKLYVEKVEDVTLVFFAIPVDELVIATILTSLFD